MKEPSKTEFRYSNTDMAIPPFLFEALYQKRSGSARGAKQFFSFQQFSQIFTFIVSFPVPEIDSKEDGTPQQQQP